jgi:hypothetical protein
LSTLDEDDFSSVNDTMEDCYPARVGYGMYIIMILKLPVQFYPVLVMELSALELNKYILFKSLNGSFIAQIMLSFNKIVK